MNFVVIRWHAFIFLKIWKVPVLGASFQKSTYDKSFFSLQRKIEVSRAIGTRGTCDESASWTNTGTKFRRQGLFWELQSFRSRFNKGDPDASSYSSLSAVISPTTLGSFYNVHLVCSTLLECLISSIGLRGSSSFRVTTYLNPQPWNLILPSGRLRPTV